MINLHIADHLATITIAQPDKKNALTQEMWIALSETITGLVGQQDIRALVLQGEGDNFCAGADISEFDSLRSDPTKAATYEQINATTFAAIRDCPIPTIAAIRGICFGGGFGIAAACDIRIADDSAKFCVPPAKLGLAYPVDAMQDIVHAIGPQRAKYMAYSAAVIDAQKALESGFILEQCPVADFQSRLDQMTTAITTKAPLSNRATKASIKAVLSGSDEDVENAMQLGHATFSSADYAEGKAAFKARRQPQFKGK